MTQIKELSSISPYLTIDYMNIHLTKWFGQETNYISHEFESTDNKGDYYLSDVWKVEVFGKHTSDNKKCSLKLLIKCMPHNIARRKTFRSHIFFRNEINFYKIILPKLLEFQSRYKLTEPFDQTPRVFAAETDGDDDFLALEDLSVHGYRSYTRQNEIDSAHYMNILKTFAQFHALSFAFRAQHPKEYESLEKAAPEVYYHAKFEYWYLGFWDKLCISAIDAVEKEYPGTKYEQKIKEFANKETFYRMCEACADEKSSKVISHGDSWTPNFMFCYDKDDVSLKCSKMIDFQLCRSASPVLDVAFFIYATSSEEGRKKYYDEGLKYYHSVLSKQITEMGGNIDEIYSFKTFMDEIKKYSFFGLGFSLESVPVIVMDKEDAFEMDNIEGTDPVKIETIWDVKPIKNKAGRQRLANNVKHAVDSGYI